MRATAAIVPRNYLAATGARPPRCSVSRPFIAVPYPRLMTRTRPIALLGISCLTGALLSGCALVHGPADRVDEFAAAGAECTGSWWIGNLREGTSDEARVVAESALAEAEVSPDALASARSLLDDSKNDYERENTTAQELEREAYMLTVTLHVKDQLEAAGYPDIDRVVEVWAESSCS